MSPDDPDHPKSWGGLTTKRGMPIKAPEMTVAESMQNNLFSKLGSPDVFMNVPTRETALEPKVNDLAACESVRPKKGGLSYSIPNEETIPRYNLTLWNTYFQNESEVYQQGLLQQLKGMHECLRMVRRHSIATGKEYGWLIRLRPDDYIYSFPSLDRLMPDSQVPMIWNVNTERCCCGNMD